MPTVNVYDVNGSIVGEIELCEEIFGAEINVPAMHAYVTAYNANQRQGTQSAKTRAEVSGGGKSPGGRRAPAVPVRDQPVLLSGLTAA